MCEAVRRSSNYLSGDVAKSINGQTTTFHYDGLDILREMGAAGEVAYLRTLAIDEALTRTDQTGTQGYLSDILGSTVALTDSSAAVATEYTYEPFGSTLVSGTPSPNPFQFTGRENDGARQYYYRARYYDPRGGRFLSEDPIGFGGGDIDLYAYAMNNPVNLTDPDGLQATCDDPCTRQLKLDQTVCSVKYATCMGWGSWKFWKLPKCVGEYAVCMEKARYKAYSCIEKGSQ